MHGRFTCTTRGVTFEKGCQTNDRKDIVPIDESRDLEYSNHLFRCWDYIWLQYAWQNYYIYVCVYSIVGVDAAKDLMRSTVYVAYSLMILSSCLVCLHYLFLVVE